VIFGNITRRYKMTHFFKSLVQSYVYLLCSDLARNDSDAGSRTNFRTTFHKIRILELVCANVFWNLCVRVCVSV